MRKSLTGVFIGMRNLRPGKRRGLCRVLLTEASFTEAWASLRLSLPRSLLAFAQAVPSARSTLPSSLPCLADSHLIFPGPESFADQQVWMDGSRCACILPARPPLLPVLLFPVYLSVSTWAVSCRQRRPLLLPPNLWCPAQSHTLDIRAVDV